MKKPKTGQTWVFHDTVPAEPMPTWKARRVKAHGEDLMVVENTFSKGDTAPEHSHPHTQAAYIISGELELTIAGEVHILKKGDTAYIGPNIKHSALAKTDTLLIDIFTPMREDFLD